VHNIIRFHIEYFSKTSISDALKGQNIGLITMEHDCNTLSKTSGETDLK